MKVAVIGASGLAGYAVIEYLAERGIEFAALVGSTGNSWRLTSQGWVPKVVNVLDREQVRAGLAGCTHVVNCSRGSDLVMLDGLDNLLTVARQTGVERFVHLGSVAVYGDPPPVASVDESAPTHPERGSYGWTKLKQDRMVRAAAERRLPSVVLCLPNIIGPGSYFLLQIMESLLRGRLPLVDDGRRACCTVDVRNVAHACFRALGGGTGRGERLFVTDTEPTTWRDIVDAVGRAAGCTFSPSAIDAEVLSADAAAGNVKPSLSVRRAFKHLASSEVRQALRGDPLLERVDLAVRAAVAALGARTEEKLRLSIEGPLRIESAGTAADAYDVRLAAQQLRNVHHRSARATREIGYEPIVTFEQSMRAYTAWLASLRGMDRGDWSLRRELFGYDGAPAAHPSHDGGAVTELSHGLLELPLAPSATARLHRR